MILCKWIGWSWADYEDTPEDVIEEAFRLMKDEADELERIRKGR